MNIKTKILSALLTLSLLYGCSAEESLVDTPRISSGANQAQVVLSISVPEVSLPSSNTRTITDDNAIENLAIWAFDVNNRFMYQLTTESRDEEGNLKVVKHGNTIYALLPKSDTKVTLSLIANYKTLTTPSVGTSLEEAEKNINFTFSKDLSYIPMYGKSAPFRVEEGAKAGNISLKRALAKIEIDASHAWPNFDLKAVTIVNVNTLGTVAKLTTITNTTERTNYTTAISNSNNTPENNNKWEFYIPEATDIDKKATRVSLILEGINLKDGDGQTRYYRLDFIKRAQNEQGIEYDYITSIERNKRYAFKIEHIVTGTGSLSFDDAVNKDKADNAITSTQLMVIDNEEIRDITTDNEYYLGVTSPELTASMSEGGDGKYYTVNMYVITNNPDGWKIDDLPQGVEVNVNQFNGDREKTTSVWVYIDKDSYKGPNPLIMYVYSGNIRKSVRISILK